jgi:hypothetical protein
MNTQNYFYFYFLLQSKGKNHILKSISKRALDVQHKSICALEFSKLHGN